MQKRQNNPNIIEDEDANQERRVRYAQMNVTVCLSKEYIHSYIYVEAMNLPVLIHASTFFSIGWDAG